MKKDIISHHATVVSVEQFGLVVHIADLDDCGACKIADLCKGNKQSDTLKIATDKHYDLAPGDQVMISIPASATAFATVWTLVMPTVLLVAIVFVLGLYGFGFWAVLIGLVAVGLWDLALWVKRRKLAKRVRWTVEPL